MRLLRAILILGIAGLAAIGPATGGVAAVAATTIPVPTLTPPPEPEVEATACAKTSTGRRLACVYVNHDRDGLADASVCAYDDVLGIFGWSLDRELVCVGTSTDWGFVSAPGVCERTFGMDEPQVCVNGRDGCLLWVTGVRVVCHAQEPPE